MKELFAPYPLALLAKEKGFDEECISFWNDYRELHFNHTYQQSHLHLKAPLYQQLVDWFRERHNIHVQFALTNPYDYRISVLEMYEEKWATLQYSVEDYYEALTAALTKAFTLIP